MTTQCGGAKYRQRITWKTDSGNAGDAKPTYDTTLAKSVPCAITQITGNETYRDRKLEGHVDYVVEMRYAESIGGSLTPKDRGVVETGVHNGKTLNISWVKNIGYRDGMPPITEVYCTELVL